MQAPNRQSPAARHSGGLLHSSFGLFLSLVRLPLSITCVNNISVYNRNPTMNISDAEAQIMDVLWDRAPQSTEDIASALQDRQDWQLSTIKTLLNRLLNKGAISAEKDGRRYLYTPVLAREQWLKRQSMGLLDRLFGGSLAPLVAQFSSERKLSDADLKALKQLIQAYEND